MTDARLAVLIDADNTSPRHVSALLDELASYGVATVKRAYGDWTTNQLNGWKQPLTEHAIQPMQQFAYTVGKNATDSALIIDAMDLLYAGNLDAFALVSSDSDFTRLATRLRESGKTVYGLGLRKTPQSLVAACNKFIYLEVLGEGSSEDEPEEERPPLPDLRRMLTRAVDRKSQDDGWASLGAIGQYLDAAQPDFDPRNYGFSKLVALVRAQDFLEVEQDGRSARVRLRPAAPERSQAPAKKTAKKAAKKATTKRVAGKRTTRKAGDPRG